MAKLTKRTFERLVAQYLEERGQRVASSPPPAHDVGVDLIATDPGSGRRTLVQMKFSGGKEMPASAMVKAGWSLQNARELLNADDAVLFVSGPTSDWAVELASKTGLSVVGADLLPEPKLTTRRRPEVHEAQEPARVETVQVRANDGREQLLERQLSDLPCGDEQWREYEQLGVELLNHLFIPSLDVPRIQTNSYDGLDRRDAIYKIGYGHAFWDALKSQCNTRFVVAEFKNGCAPPDQRDVESLQQYLYTKGLRTVGLLCVRNEPSVSALKAQHRAWNEFGKLILFVSDEDFRALLKLKTVNDDPASLLDVKMDAFFADVTP